MDFIRQTFQGSQSFIAHLFLETPASWLGIDRIIRLLDTSGQSLFRRASAVRGRPNNQEILSHIIGIERWGQRRLRVVLGEPLIFEEYNPYLPGSSDWQQLLQLFRGARQETISLSKSLRMVGLDPALRVPHNQFGDLSLLGWLYYLNLHASLESVRIN